MFDRSRTRFHDKNAAQDFFCAVSKVFDSENRSPMVRKKKKIIKRTIKGYSSAANTSPITGIRIFFKKKIPNFTNITTCYLSVNL
jgi:hypothetical protein